MENFKVAAKRHYDDAKYLNGDGRVVNAGQLYGLAAECCIKAVLMSQPNCTINPRDVGHINQAISSRYINQLSISVQGRSSQNYYAMIPNIQYFGRWRIAHRYWEDSAIPNDIEDWQTAAREARLMLDQAIVDGVVT